MVDLIKPYEFDETVYNAASHKRNAVMWDTLTAARDGDHAKLKAILEKYPRAVDSEFWYTKPLHFAVREGHIDVAQLLLDAGADLTHQGFYDEEPLIQIARERQRLDMVEWLKQVYKNQLNSEGRSDPIHRACSEGDREMVEKLIDEDATAANRGDEFGRRPLHYAVERKHTEIIELLVKCGADIDAEGFPADTRLGSFGFRPIVQALWKHNYWSQINDYETARLLLGLGAKYTITIAAALGDLDGVRNMLAKDAELCNFIEPGGKRPLSAAAERDHEAIVRCLLDAGANPNLPEGPNCPRGYALWVAARRANREITEMLLQAGADPNASVESSGTPTSSATDASIRTLLYGYGGKVSLSQFFFEGALDSIATALQFAPERFNVEEVTQGFTLSTTNRHVDLVRLLLARGYRLPATVTVCQTYLWHDIAIARILLEHGMDPDLPNWQRVAPLHHMAKKGLIDEAKLFLEFGANPFTIDEEYRSTPLSWAARNNQIGFIRFLLDRYPAYLAERVDDEETWSRPANWAKSRGHDEILQELQ